jgi:predicted DsbA family dithiol-disulfide isomerase
VVREPEWRERLVPLFADAGLELHPGLSHQPNSRKALMLGELARERRVFERLHPRLFHAYWAEGRDIGDEAVLLEEGAAAGLEAGDIRSALADERHLEQVESWTRALFEFGAGGVPAWLVDERLMVPGAQPRDVFERVLERLGHAPLEQ